MKRIWNGIAWAIATWFGCGLVPKAPGTMGTLGAIPIYVLVAPFGRVAVGAAALVVTVIGVWSASIVARALGTKDPQLVVVDEVAGMLVTMLPVAHPSWVALTAGFALFRLLDVVKPWPVHRFEKLPGGLGIVMDDVAAGVLGAGAMALLQEAGALR